MSTLLVPISKNQHTLIDEADAEFVLAHQWYAHPSRNGTFYVKRTDAVVDGKRVSRFLHRELLNARPGETVDHINFDKLDNRRCNLRIATQQQNMAHRPVQSNNTSGFKGIRFRNGSWSAQTKYNGTNIHIGVYGTAEEAARAYDRVAHELFGEFAYLNFREAGK